MLSAVGLLICFLFLPLCLLSPSKQWGKGKEWGMGSGPQRPILRKIEIHYTSLVSADEVIPNKLEISLDPCDLEG